MSENLSLFGDIHIPGSTNKTPWKTLCTARESWALGRLLGGMDTHCGSGSCGGQHWSWRLCRLKASMVLDKGLPRSKPFQFTLPLRGIIIFPHPWIWGDFLTCFGKQHALKVTLCQFYTWVSRVLPYFCPWLTQPYHCHCHVNKLRWAWNGDEPSQLNHHRPMRARQPPNMWESPDR